jgi:hypothetical protein
MAYYREEPRLPVVNWSGSKPLAEIAASSAVQDILLRSGNNIAQSDLRCIRG